MINSVTVTNHLGKSLRLELARPELTGLAITSLTGIGPGKATINTTELATTDGSIYNSAKMPERNIVIEITYLFYNTIEEARHISYEYFPLKKKITLEFETELKTVKIEGYVESNDPNIFSKQVKSQISIVCPDPYFYAIQDQVTYFSSVIPEFEFPFSNEGLDLTNVPIPAQDIYPSSNLYPGAYQFAPDIEFGSLTFDKIQNIYYEGNADTGIYIKMHALASASDLKIYSITHRGEMDIDTSVLTSITGNSIVRGDDIEICTIKGKKKATLLRNGITYNILNAINRDAEWFQLTYGDNAFAYDFDGDTSAVQFEIYNNILFEGI